MQNKEGEEPVKCLPLTGKIGDFLYHPRLDVDISEAQKFYIRPTATAAPSGPTVASGAAVASGPLAVEDDLATLEAEIAALEGQAAPVQAAPVQAVPVQAAPVQAAPVQAAPVKAKAKVIARHLPPETVMKKYEGTTYAFAPIKDANQVTTGFRMLDPKTGVHVGYASIKNGVPATPIDLLPNQAKK
jgi:hypothetical protein